MREISLIIILVCLFCAMPVSALTKLSVPFTSQAPHGDWSQPWQDACEESSIAMVDAFYTQQQLTNPDSAAQKIQWICHLKESVYGPSLDENAYKVSEIIDQFLPWEATRVKNPTLEQIKSEIDAGHPVILPAYGKALQNPNFQGNGPVYHMIVLVGYDERAQEFITHDPGTRFGLDYRYTYDRIMDAIHDFLPNGKTSQGEKVAIFTDSIIGNSAIRDGDGDNLTKIEELIFGSVLWLRDSDGDGFSDGAEVLSHYSPTNHTRIKINTDILLKSPSDPKVYLLYRGKKRYVANEEVFLGHEWQWNQIMMMQDETVDAIPNGTIIDS